MTNQTQDPFTELANGYQKMMMDTWSTWTKATVSSDAFAQGSASMMDWNLATQNKMKEMTGQYLEALDMPRRSDLARLSEQVLTLEKRLADGEDERDELHQKLSAVESKLDKVLEVLSQQAATSKKAATPKAAAKKTATKTNKKSVSTKKTNVKKTNIKETK